MRRVIDLSFKCLSQQLFVVVTLLAASSLVWGEGDAPTISGAGEPEVTSFSASSDLKVETKKRLVSPDEPREMTGIVMGAVVVNLTLITVFFVLLWKEWKKHKVVPKPALNDKREGK